MDELISDARTRPFADQSLGERIVRAARLAAAIHLYQAAAPEKIAERTLRQRVAIGGAGPRIDWVDPRWDNGREAAAEPQLPRIPRRPESHG